MVANPAARLSHHQARKQRFGFAPWPVKTWRDPLTVFPRRAGLWLLDRSTIWTCYAHEICGFSFVGLQ
jgi:hypothetical protein